jgi:hypothetical protein
VIATQEFATRPKTEESADGGDRPRSATKPHARLLLAIAGLFVIASSIVILLAGAQNLSPTAAEALRVMTVSEALAAHSGGQLADERAAVRGWWSNGSFGHACAPPIEPVGELELYCHDGEYGITERDEQIFVVDVGSGRIKYTAKSPHLTPFVSAEVPGSDVLFTLPTKNGQLHPPVPIAVVGHFDDARAEACRSAARDACAHRFVLERILELSIDLAPTPDVTPQPTAFPDPPPPPLFGAEACAGAVPYAFQGWTTPAVLGLPRERPRHVYAMVTRDPVLLSDGWVDDPNGSGHRFQLWGPNICFAGEEWGHEGEMSFENVPGRSYVLWDDGLRVPGWDATRPPGSS